MTLIRVTLAILILKVARRIAFAVFPKNGGAK